MAIERKPRSQDRKEQHATADHEDLSSSHFSPPEFWDCLPKVWLTRRALRELDRRNQSDRGACTPVPARAPKPLHHLKRFARHGGPELCDLRGYPEPTDINLVCTMSSKRSGRSGESSHSNPSSESKESKSAKLSSNSVSKTSKKRKSSAYDANFESCIAEKKIYIEGYVYPDGRQTPEPSDYDQVRQKLAVSRPSLSPSQFTESNFRRFKQANTRVIVEDEVMRDVIPTMCGETKIQNRQNLSYTKLESITDKTTVMPKPDFYDGARIENIDKRVLEVIDEELTHRQTEEDPSKESYSYLVPTKHMQAPVAPNFFLEVKTAHAGTDVVKRQACLDGALGARAIHKLQSYVAGEPVYDNTTLSITSTFQAGNLNMYATHVTPTGPGGSPEYHMSQLGGWNTIGDSDTCRRGMESLRNARDLSREKRDQLIMAANEKARSMNVELSTIESSDIDFEMKDAEMMRCAEEEEEATKLALSRSKGKGKEKAVEVQASGMESPVSALRRAEAEFLAARQQVLDARARAGGREGVEPEGLDLPLDDEDDELALPE